MSVTLIWKLEGPLLTAGLDEAGRGPLAGPVFAAAVILGERASQELQGINDSKKLSAKKREDFSERIRAEARAWALAEASVEEIESFNILEASLLAMRRALEALHPQAEAALVDGNRDPRLGVPTQTVVDGDASYACIAAASILAKVARDARMQELHQRFPEYGFDRHKGYGTVFHQEAIRRHGPCPEHRKLFLRKLMAKSAH